jgi:SAM-dependent methyltransferase
VEDIGFYVAEARKARGTVVELGVGTGRIAVPTAEAGVPVIGVDSSAGMLEVCRARAVEAGVADLLDLRLGDLRNPPVDERVRLVTCPFRSFLHLTDDEDRLTALRAAHELLVPDGMLVFDVFEPSAEDVEETDGRWVEREPGIWERADWGTRERTLTLTLSVHGQRGKARLALSWLSAPEWQALIERAGFRIEACFGWFDRRPYQGGEDSVWLARRV